MIYEFVCHDCRVTFEVTRNMAQASIPERCPVCDQEARRIFSPLPVMNRKKPGSVAAMIERGCREGDGNASTLAALNHAEQIGGAHWRKVKSEIAPSELRSIERYKNNA